MGATTASGGYWISAEADKIFAHKNTITGSIGIFGMLASFEQSLKSIGISNDGIQTTKFSTPNGSQNLTPEMEQLIQTGIEKGYEKFIEIVAKGRNMTLNEVDKIAQGKIWTGLEAKDHGLVDEIGNLQDAIVEAGKLAKIDKYDVLKLKDKPSAKNLLLKELLNTNSLINKVINPSIFTDFDDPQGQYVLCQNCVETK